MSSTKPTILLIRHGQTDWNLAGRWQGHTDIPLNDTGRQQATLLAKRLAKWPIQAFVSSDLKRAHETAQIIAAKHQQTVHKDPIWRERHVGDFQGNTGEESRKLFPEVWKQEKNGVLEPPNAEPFSDLKKRANEALERVMTQYPQGMTAVVSHGQLIHVLLGLVMGIRDDVYGRFSIRGNTGLSIVTFGSNHPVVSRINDTAHLE